MERGRAYFMFFSDFRESWNVMMEPLRAYFFTLANTCRPFSRLSVVAGYKIPHHDAVFPFQDHILQPSHVSVRRSEQIRMEIGVGFVGIGQIVPAQVFESADMIEGVVADAVPSFDYHRNSSGCLRTLSPTMKKVALM